MATVYNPPANQVYKDYDVFSLEGYLLDLAVANTLNIAVTTNRPTGYLPQPNVKYYTIGRDGLAKDPFAPATFWQYAGPYIYDYRISIIDKGGKNWGAIIRVDEMTISINAKNPIHAAMRALVASTYGATIHM